ncbi:protein EXORDIUM-like 4 [Rosa sericea]
MVFRVAVATQALLLILLLTTPHFVLAGKKGGGGGKKGGGKKGGGGKGGGKKPSAPYRPPKHGGGGAKNKPSKPATPYRPPVVVQPKKPEAAYTSLPEAAITIDLPRPGTQPGGPASKGHGEGIIYKGGPLLTGELNLSIIFYGQWQSQHKDLIRSFLSSLAVPGSTANQWWAIVEGYQTAANMPNQGVHIKVGTQSSDDKASLGKVLTKDFIKQLVQRAKSGNPNTLAVIFAHKDVAVSELCRGKCYEHGAFDNVPYLIVGNPEVECPGSCAIPFAKASYGPAGNTVKPPNGDLGVDATIINFASGLASVVTNPFNGGFSKPGPKTWAIEAGNACEDMFGSGAGPGQPGKMTIDAAGCGYNAVGDGGARFLLPAIWDPKSCTCWTPM